MGASWSRPVPVWVRWSVPSTPPGCITNQGTGTWFHLLISLRSPLNLSLFQNQLDPSIDLLKKVLDRSSQSAHIHHQLALCYMRKKKLLTQKPQRPEKEVQSLRRHCIHHLEETVRLKSSVNHAKAALALQYAEDYQRNRARETFEDVLEKLEKEPDSIRQFSYHCYTEFLQYHTTQKDLAITYYIKGQLTAGGWGGDRLLCSAVFYRVLPGPGVQHHGTRGETVHHKTDSDRRATSVQQPQRCQGPWHSGSSGQSQGQAEEGSGTLRESSGR